MTTQLTPSPLLIDLAGYCPHSLHYFQVRSRLNYLTERYLSMDILSERLIDLPYQFEAPKPRPWEVINWKAIAPDQIIGVEPQLFLHIIAASAEVEAPIRSYAQISYGYLKHIHPAMTTFVGGTTDANGKTHPGVWEKEERQHAPAFRKMYEQLTGDRLTIKPNSIQILEPVGQPMDELYRHALRRMTTEWSAVSLYLWLMAHSTGALQQAIAQPLQDEVNHLAKFWGMARWGFRDALPQRLQGLAVQFLSLYEHHQGDRSGSQDIFNLRNLGYGTELGFAYARVLRQLYRWNTHLDINALNQLFGPRTALSLA